MVSDQEEVKKTKRLELLLLEELERTGRVPHKAFLSEREIRERFGFNQTTVRRALNALAQRGYLYRENGRGTFIAPKKQRTVLFVTRHSLKQYGVEHSAVLDLFAGTLSACEDHPEYGITCSLITSREMLRQLEDCDQVYPDLAALVFFSDIETCRTCQPVLEEKGLPFVYYGTDRPLNPNEFPYCFTYNQAAIVDQALSFLVRQGYQKIGLLCSEPAPRLERYELALQWLEERGMPPPPERLYRIDYPYNCPRPERYAVFASHLAKHPLPEDTDALFCMDDSLALYFIHGMYRNGQAVLGRIALIGVNNLPLCTEVIPQLTTVEIPFFSDGIELLHSLRSIIEGSVSQFHKLSRTRVVFRDSA